VSGTRGCVESGWEKRSTRQASPIAPARPLPARSCSPLLSPSIHPHTSTHPPKKQNPNSKNGFLVIKGRPCKVADVSTSKTGKHGHAKCHFVAIDIFTGKKYEDLTPSSHNCDVPHVNRQEYSLLDVSDDGFLSLMDEAGNTKDDLGLPKGTDDAEKLADQIKKDFEDGKELVVSVLKAMGEEMVCAVKSVGGAS
jgi:translation initiation factor 5A